MKVIFPELTGKVVWAKRSGSSMEQLAREPRRCLGLYSIGNDSLYLIEGEGPPTTEIYAHLMIYNETFHRAVVHCHWPRIELARERIDEGGLPQWIGTVGPLAPGSIELAEATGMEMRGRSVVVWERHGVVGAGPDIGKCLSSLEDAHKALFRSDLKAPHSSGGPVRPRRR